MKKILSIVLCIVCLLGTISFAGCNNLSVEEKKLYELILDVSYEFKNPQSVRVVSGTCNYYPDVDENYISAYLRLSAKNGFGAETSGYYFCGHDSEDGKVFCYDLESYGTSYDIKKCNEREDFDIKKINNALDKYWN